MNKPKPSPLIERFRQLRSDIIAIRGDDRFILFFRLGDFYETFDDDALILRDRLGAPLSVRSGTSMAGVFHAEFYRTVEELKRKGYATMVADETK